MKKKTIIFCQASSDLLYTLDLISKHKYVIVYVINVKVIYEYLISLEIKDIEVKFYPYFKLNLFNPKTIFKTVSELIEDPKKIESQLKKTQLILNNFKTQTAPSEKVAIILNKLIN